MDVRSRSFCVIIVVTGFPSLAQERINSMGVTTSMPAADLVHAELVSRPVAHSTLWHSGTARIPAHPGVFLAKSLLCKPEGRAQLGVVSAEGSPTFGGWYLHGEGQYESDLPEAEIHGHDLYSQLFDDQIRDRFGASRESPAPIAVTMHALCTCLREQHDGREGFLLTSGRAWNVFYIREGRRWGPGPLHAVIAVFDGGWHLFGDSEELRGPSRYYKVSFRIFAPIKLCT